MKFHIEILSKEQKNLLSFIKQFNDKFVLVGGTAIALQIGHRESIDFDLFLPNKERLPIQKINKAVNDVQKKVFWFTNKDYCKSTQLRGVKFTWFAYMFGIPQTKLIDFQYIKIPNLLHLAAMKVHAMGNRAKWKDYVDMYFLIKEFGIENIISYAKDFFKGEVNIKLFLSQLSFFEDIDYTEEVNWMPGFEKTDKEIKMFLQKVSLDAMKIV